ncbi:uncharacterized protein LOC132703295 [Cylas formicarius]|uniref:uncharacterized protein LOC132703295 n=1 Tax=Cylas formicarius TaxID=197179 RepID=UPI0029589B5B|nr:uncharacterized protein LOC132703295 [Cylas formicarius]
MVIPIDKRHLDNSEDKKYIGNNLKLTFLQNSGNILVTGNNCVIQVADNRGSVKVVGNNCRVKVNECKGLIDYVGNNGKITIDEQCRDDAITYIGNNGQVIRSSKNSSEIICGAPNTASLASNFTKSRSAEKLLAHSSFVSDTQFKVMLPNLSIELSSFLASKATLVRVSNTEKRVSL